MADLFSYLASEIACRGAGAPDAQPVGVADSASVETPAGTLASLGPPEQETQPAGGLSLSHPPAGVCLDCGKPVTRKCIRCGDCNRIFQNAQRRKEWPICDCGKRCSDPRSRYCSVECSSTARRIARPPCQQCGKPTTRKGRIFCSDICARITKTGRRADAARDARIRELYPTHTIKRIAEIIGSSETNTQRICARLGLVRGAPLSKRSNPHTRYSIEQIAVLRRLYATKPWEVVRDEMNALDGWKIKTPKQLQWLANRHGLKKADGFKKTRWAERVIPEKPEPVRDPRVKLRLREVYQWAFTYGCARTIEAVSRAAKREDKSHPGFVLYQPNRMTIDMRGVGR